MKLLRKPQWKQKVKCKTCGAVFEANEGDLVIGVRGAHYWAGDEGKKFPA